jgi:hypothetical protein
MRSDRRVARRTICHRGKRTASVARPKLGDGRVFVGPVAAAAGQDTDTAGAEPSVHPVAVVLDLVQPCVPVGSLIHQSAELRRDPCRRTCVVLTARCRAILWHRYGLH